MKKKISELSFPDFLDLVNFLKEDKKESLLIERVARFFPGLSALQAFELNFVIGAILEEHQNAANFYENFRDEYKDLEFDPEGKASVDLSKDYWEITLKSLDNLYDIAKHNISKNKKDTSKHRRDTQICNGRDLKNLMKIEVEKPNYQLTKLNFLKKNPENRLLNKETLKEIESNLTKLNLSLGILERVLLYTINKQEENYAFFVRHFTGRLEILTKDSTIRHQSNKIFLENLKKIK